MTLMLHGSMHARDDWLPLADLESAKAAARSKAAKKNAARKSKKAAQGEAPSVASVTNGMALTR